MGVHDTTRLYWDRHCIEADRLKPNWTVQQSCNEVERRTFQALHPYDQLWKLFETKVARRYKVYIWHYISGAVGPKTDEVSACSVMKFWASNFNNEHVEMRAMRDTERQTKHVNKTMQLIVDQSVTWYNNCTNCGLSETVATGEIQKNCFLFLTKVFKKSG